MDFYYLPGSAPCRSVMMAAKSLGVELNKKLLDLWTKEQLKPEFIKINPQHTIPTLVDNGFSVWDSRTIMIYLVQKYGKDDTLYPKDPQKQAVVNQRLFFDSSVLYQAFADYYYPIIMTQSPPNPEMFKKIENAMSFLNTFLEGHEYVAGDNLTIADLSILATVSTYDVANFEIKKYPNISKWYEHCKNVVPGWEENWEGCLEMKKFIK